MAKFIRRPDPLGLRSALSDRLLPVLVAAMSFLAALAIGGTLASAALAAQWQGDAQAALTIQVPAPDAPAAGHQGKRLEAVLATLQATPGITDAVVLSTDRVNQLLAPWLGADVAELALPIPAVMTANWAGPAAPDALTAALDRVAPGTLLTSGADWAARVATLTTSLQACAVAVLVIVAMIAAGTIAVATRSGLAQRREAIAIIHGLGALDTDIADRFAARATFLAASGAAIGALAALPVLFWLASLAAPFAAGAGPAAPGLPPALWVALPSLPLIASGIGWGTAQFTVRGWLRNLA